MIIIQFIYHCKLHRNLKTAYCTMKYVIWNYIHVNKDAFIVHILS